MLKLVDCGLGSGLGIEKSFEDWRSCFFGEVVVWLFMVMVGFSCFVMSVGEYIVDVRSYGGCSLLCVEN